VGRTLTFVRIRQERRADVARGGGGQQVSRGTDGPQRVVLRVPAH